jgi:hypothetical protein
MNTIVVSAQIRYVIIFPAKYRFNDGSRCGPVKYAGLSSTDRVSKSGHRILLEKALYGDVLAVKHQRKLSQKTTIAGVEKWKIQRWIDLQRLIVVHNRVCGNESPVVHVYYLVILVHPSSVTNLQDPVRRVIKCIGLRRCVFAVKNRGWSNVWNLILIHRVGLVDSLA